ncbi:hypothetical protein [Sphingobium sp. CCH11-B1]|jgi:hypothetical protein|uniref:hypothetical protein n=1 Tax=Sphingobium sp. CCH11-B1 TaxID=1768781 RepID=UPI000829DF32|nr:hypothetical protein [Sphingobium sp. CCH11-B1]
MSDRQHSLHDLTSQGDPETHIAPVQKRATRFSWLWALLSVSAFSSAFSITFYIWASFGHLILPDRYTYSIIFGDRQGMMTGQQHISSAKGTVFWHNTINDGTAKSEGQKQATVLDETTKARASQEASVQEKVLVETTGARAAQEAAIQAKVVQETAALQASAECLRQITVAAAAKEADCIGTGVSGGECSARRHLIEQLAPTCGELTPSPTTGETRHDR